MASAALHRALTGPGPRPLPERAARLLQDVDAPPRPAAELIARSGEPSWEAFMDLDDVCDRIASGAGRRLGFQSAYPVA